ncbi:MAG: haloalkane dehalogenase [Gemmatimonadetes bacterium]|nr:haloalkane dehalogenase [Gemmatimonadota bacterium]
MKALPTPDHRFEHLPDFPFTPRYLQLDTLRIHYVDEGRRDAAPVLLMHGEPSWSFLYRHMIPLFVAAGHRAIAPDLIGFGRSDKPVRRSDYTYQRHVDWMTQWLLQLDLHNLTLVCQDWGSLIGLRLAAEHPERFARIVLANGGLPTGQGRGPVAFRLWQMFAARSPWFPIGRIVSAGCRRPLPAAARAAYDAPFPDERYKQGARAFPALVPTTPNDPAAPANRKAWDVLRRWEKPFLTAFSDGDPITRGLDRAFRRRIPGARDQRHTTIVGAGHFLQEDRGPEFARVVIDFIAAT